MTGDPPEVTAARMVANNYRLAGTPIALTIADALDEYADILRTLHRNPIG